MKAIRIHEHGGPEVMRWEEMDVGEPGPGEARVRHTAVGLNYIDVNHRGGAYPLDLPTGLGMEAAGVVEAVGDGVTRVGVGDRVAYASPPPGSYAEARVVAADVLVVLPDEIDDRTAAAMMLKGMTAQYLVRRTYPVQAGDTVLVHAAAGGVGLLLCQWASHLGARVIGTVGSDEKAELAAGHGCDHPVVYRREDFAERVRELTDGAGVAAAYDAVGRDTVPRSLDSLALRGHLVVYGAASGPPDPIAMPDLAKRSTFVTRPLLFHYVGTRAELESTAADLFDVVTSGAVRIEIRQTFPLAEAAEAHRALEGRATTGSTVLLP